MVISFRAPLDDFYTTRIEHRDADGKKRDYKTSRTSEGGQHLERANADCSVTDPAEKTVSPTT
jgi:hypothetical protein